MALPLSLSHTHTLNSHVDSPLHRGTAKLESLARMGDICTADSQATWLPFLPDLQCRFFAGKVDKEGKNLSPYVRLDPKSSNSRDKAVEGCVGAIVSRLRVIDHDE